MRGPLLFAAAFPGGLLAGERSARILNIAMGLTLAASVVLILS